MAQISGIPPDTPHRTAAHRLVDGVKRSHATRDFPTADLGHIPLTRMVYQPILNEKIRLGLAQPSITFTLMPQPVLQLRQTL